MLTGVTRFLVPSSVVTDTERSLREAGRDGYERFVLWSGMVRGTDFLVRTTHVPEQRSYRLPDGLCVTIDGPALHALNVWLFDHREVLGVQVHSHPKDAYHSETDDTFPVVTLLGGISLVVPDFCVDAMFAGGHAVYRLTHDGWEDQPDDLIEVT